jgi:hypothetical protein
LDGQGGELKAVGIAIPLATLNQKTYATFNGGTGLKSLHGLCLDLLSEQQKVWQDLREGFESLKRVKERDLSCRGFTVRLQHNPRRMKSSLAGVAEKNITDRPCFLCIDHLSEAQKGILYRRDYMILCNPMPILPSQLTISYLDHQPQTILEHINTFFHLMADFGPNWVILYNGPKCGASAPDHHHFHAARSGEMPIEREILEENRLTLIKKVEGVLLCRVNDIGREIVLLEGDDPVSVGPLFRGYLSSLKKVLSMDEEPLINMAGFYGKKRWHLVIFPRRKHRPDAFFKEGDDRIVVSPGAIDMGGLLVTPMEKDFERLDSTALESIYEEVSLEGAMVERTIDAME